MCWEVKANIKKISCTVYYHDFVELDQDQLLEYPCLEEWIVSDQNQHHCQNQVLKH